MRTRGGSRRRRWLIAAGSFVAVLALLAGAWMMVDANRFDTGDAPLPGPASDATSAPPLDEQNPSSVMYDTAGEGLGVPRVVDPQTMGPNRIYIPSSDPFKVVYAPFSAAGIAADGQLVIPSNPSNLTLYSGGGAVCGSQGTVLLAGHVSSHGKKGALHYLASVPQGTLVYATCSDGTLTKWVTSAPQAAPKDSLPQGVFNASGKRRMVLVTCGGALRRDGTFADNVRVDLLPVD